MKKNENKDTNESDTLEKQLKFKAPSFLCHFIVFYVKRKLNTYEAKKEKEREKRRERADFESQPWRRRPARRTRQREKGGMKRGERNEKQMNDRGVSKASHISTKEF